MARTDMRRGEMAQRVLWLPGGHGSVDNLGYPKGRVEMEKDRGGGG